VDEAQILIGREFGTASSGKPPVVTTAPEAPLEKQIVAHHTRANGGAIVLAWRSTGIDKPEDVVAMDTLLSLWREGLDANLRKLLMRDGEKGPNTPLVASYDVDYLTQRDPGLFAVDLSDPQDSDAAVQAVLDEVKRVQTQGISDAELERAKDELRSQYVIQSDTVNGQGGALGFYDMINNYRFGQYYLDRAARVTAADVQRVAKAYLSPDNYIRVDISPLPPPSQDEGGGPAITAEVPATGHLVTWHTESSR